MTPADKSYIAAKLIANDLLIETGFTCANITRVSEPPELAGWLVSVSKPGGFVTVSRRVWDSEEPLPSERTYKVVER